MKTLAIILTEPASPTTLLVCEHGLTDQQCLDRINHEIRQMCINWPEIGKPDGYREVDGIPQFDDLGQTVMSFNEGEIWIAAAMRDEP